MADAIPSNNGGNGVNCVDSRCKLGLEDSVWISDGLAHESQGQFNTSKRTCGAWNSSYQTRGQSFPET